MKFKGFSFVREPAPTVIAAEFVPQGHPFCTKLEFRQKEAQCEAQAESRGSEGNLSESVAKRKTCPSEANSKTRTSGARTKQSWFGFNVGKMLKQVQHDELMNSVATSPLRHPELVSGSHKAWGFTLAEALITLAIIGVIAAVALPVVVTNVQNRLRAEQIRMAKYKFTKATDLMNLNGKIGPYYATTADFVQELGDYLKIAKVCDNSHLSDCFGYEEINLGDGEIYKVSDIKTGTQMKMNKTENSDYTSDNVGIITLDGTSMILSWNTKCAELNYGQIYGWGTENGKPVSNATAGCVAAVMDINGSGKPNTLNKDVALFNANGIGYACAIRLKSGKCLGAVFSPTPLTHDECEARKNQLGIQQCCASAGCISAGDYWAGAVAQCGGLENMPTMSELAEIVSMIYVGSPTVAGRGNKSGLTYISGTATTFGLPEPFFYLWSSEEFSQNLACDRSYATTYSNWDDGNDDGHRYINSNLAACLTD